MYHVFIHPSLKCRKRPCRGAERTTWRGKRSPPTSRGRWATSRPRSRSTAAATPSCARRTALWPRNWRDSSRNTTSERRYWFWHARVQNKVWKWNFYMQHHLKNCTKTSHRLILCASLRRINYSHISPELSHLLASVFQFLCGQSSPEQEMKQLSVWKRLINSPDCLPEPGKGLQTQRPERKAAGHQTHAGEHVAEGGRGEAQAGKGACTFRVPDLSTAMSISKRRICNSNPLMLVFLWNVLIFHRC